MKPVGYTFLDQYYKFLLPKLGVEVYQDPKAETGFIISYSGSKRRLLHILAMMNNISSLNVKT